MEPRQQGEVASCNFLDFSSRMAKAKKAIDEAREQNFPELDLCDKGIVSFEEMPGLCK